MKTGVDKPDWHGPKINRTSGERAVHYATLVDPHRRSSPRSAGRFHCCGCGARSDVADYVREHEKLSFLGAIHVLETGAACTSRAVLAALSPPEANDPACRSEPYGLGRFFRRVAGLAPARVQCAYISIRSIILSVFFAMALPRSPVGDPEPATR